MLNPIQFEINSLNEPIDVAQNGPHSKLMSTLDTAHSYLCVPGKNE